MVYGKEDGWALAAFFGAAHGARAGWMSLRKNRLKPDFQIQKNFGEKIFIGITK